MKKVIISICLLALILIPAQLTQAQTDPTPTPLPNSFSYDLVRAKEWLNLNLFTYQKTSKVKLLNRYTDDRLKELNYAASINRTQAVERILARYQEQKELALKITQELQDTSLINQICQRTYQQQRQMTILQLRSANETIREQIIATQNQVANLVTNMVKIVQGDEEGEKVYLEIKKIWYDSITVFGDPATGERLPTGDWNYTSKYRGDAGASNQPNTNTKTNVNTKSLK